MSRRVIALVGAVWFAAAAGAAAEGEPARAGSATGAPGGSIGERRQVLELEAELRALRDALVRAREESDRLRLEVRSARAGETLPGYDGVGTPREAMVLEADRALGFAALGAGAEDGMRAGLTYRVLRGDEVIAAVETTAVRRRLAGAIVRAVRKGEFPRAGDRAVLGKPAEREALEQWK
jgi:hypothetical protein